MDEDMTIQETFEDIYKFLVTFSNQIEEIRQTTYELTVLLSDSMPRAWEQFITYFDMGAYDHPVECLRVTNAYSPIAIKIWVEELVFPARDNFMEAMQFMDEIKKYRSFKERLN